MANIFRQAISWLYTTLAVSILGIWTLLILACVGITAVDSNPGLLQLIALPSLLTFLVAKLIVAASPSTTVQQTTANARNAAATGGNLATWLATADYGSPHGALVLFLFSVTWLLHLARVVLALFVVVLMGAFFVFASTLDVADKEETAANGEGMFSDEGARKNFTTALTAFEEQAGIGLGDYVADNPWVIFQVFVALWGMMNLLLMYLFVYAFGAIRKVLTTPLETWARSGQEPPAPALVAGGSPATAAAAGAAPVPGVVVEKERVVAPAVAQPAN
ncbi:hypothetical protein CORC01_11890 [Colletotrichum orchidophilum]|uniref:Uncharacterized protein n=1 Tax=Colletotrichum orchidophilum TaxID=1209926 RepID=A0A1G4AUS9_9PEZI|nr:uncharacterized protein CORC01_11890 [Colletotrichum orchidophilum]OHE92812.1 hypothetical protein CORC01_11890 [Colletotrichum orchidophilum]